MSNCGNCRSKLCTCQLIGDSKVNVLGIGSSYEPYQARPKTPLHRPVEVARRLGAQSITLGTPTAIIFTDTEIPSTTNHMWVVGAPTRITVAIGGLYLIGAFAAQSAAAASQVWDVWISKNGTIPLVRNTTSSQLGTTQIVLADVMTLVRLNAGDYLELFVKSTRTASTPIIYASTVLSPRLWAQWMDE